MRVKQPAGTKGSLKWVQTLVATGRADDGFREALGLAAEVSIDWRSPRAEDDFAEYRDAAFLRLVGLERLAEELRRFWPERGPQWDALAVSSDGRVLLIEAKAHVAEMVSSCGAGAVSRERIEQTLNECKRRVGARAESDWGVSYYQYANRLAHLQFLRDQGIRAELVFVYFVGDPDMGSTTLAEWAAGIDACYDHLGFDADSAIPGVHRLFVNVGADSSLRAAG
jgi:hypothetical protein